MKYTVKYRIRPTPKQDEMLRSLGFFATKLFNTDNYIRREQWATTNKLPNYIEQQKALKVNHWYRLLPSQTSQRVIKTVQEAYNSWFTLRKTDYRARETHLSHFVNDGCFRCHHSSMVNDEGEHLAYDCRSCHLIVAQGPSESIDELEMNLAGLDFKHPEEIDEMWRDMKCTECHTPESGY